jgi:hypothetical protein
MGSRILISNQTLATSAASVTFSSIPQTYTDLVLRFSARCNEATISTNLLVEFNGDYLSPTTYSDTYLSGNGSTPTSSKVSNDTAFTPFFSIDGNSATANTFGNGEVYIPNYTSTTNKPISNFGVGESNATAVSMSIVAGLYRTSSAITQIALYPNNLGNLVSGSSFALYGIKNS